MQIVINTGQNIKGDQDFINYAEELMKKHFDRYSEDITRIEVHVSDENGPKGGDGVGDKRCLIEARLRGMQPIAITVYDDSLHNAMTTAAEKAQRTIGKHIEKRRGH